MRNEKGQFVKGNVGYWKGKKRPPMSEEWKKKIGDAFRGKKLSEEHRRKIKENHARYWKGKKNPLLEETKEKIRQANLGKKHSRATRELLSKKLLGKPRYDLRGENHPNWRGGRIFKRESIMNLVEYKKWRSDVYKRDNYICVKCGYDKGRILVADHIKPLAIIFEQNNIDSVKKALSCKEIWDVNNGRTLCIPCHKKTSTYCRKLTNEIYATTVV